MLSAMPDPGARSVVSWLRRWQGRLRGLPRKVSRRWTRDIYRWQVQGAQHDCLEDPRITVGRHTYGLRAGSVNSLLSSPDDRLVIGSFCSLAERVQFVFGEHPVDAVSTFPLRTILQSLEGNVKVYSLSK